MFEWYFYTVIYIYIKERDKMNDNFKCIYRILKSLEKAMDYESIDIEEIGYEHLGISKNR